MTQLNGKCFCGKNKYSLSGTPEFQFICYCNGCRTLNSGGHLCGLIFDANLFTEATDTQTFDYPGGSGDPITLHFCPTCSTQLYAFPHKYAGKVVVRANTLEDMEFKPQQNLFVEEKFSWDPVNP